MENYLNGEDTSGPGQGWQCGRREVRVAIKCDKRKSCSDRNGSEPLVVILHPTSHTNPTCALILDCKMMSLGIGVKDTGSCYVTQARLKLTILLGYKCAPPCPAVCNCIGICNYVQVKPVYFV